MIALLSRLRLLPVTIFVAVLMIGFRVGDLWEAVVDGAEIQAVAPTVAQEAAPEAMERLQDESVTDEDAGQGVAAIDSGALEDGFSSEEITLLQQLASRREELDARARVLDEREALLAAAEQRIDRKVVELDALRTEIRGLLREVDEQQQAQLGSLVKIYENMKPKDAAQIFQALDMTVLLDVLERMREAKSAPILAAMSPAKAMEVTASLAERRQLPEMPE